MFYAILLLLSLPTYATPPTSPIPQATPAPDFTGNYTIHKGTTFQGKSYTGKVQITAEGPAYRVRWDLGKMKYEGVGLAHKQRLFVGWAMHNKCGIVLYKITDKQLQGKWVHAVGKVGMGTELITLTGDLEGTHKGTGTHVDGSPYQVHVSIKKAGQVYHVMWQSGKATYQGSGRKVGDILAIGWGLQKQYGYIEYLKKGKTLEGKWTGPNMTRFASETLQK